MGAVLMSEIKVFAKDYPMAPVDKFIPYAFVLVFLYCTVFLTIEAFSFFNWLEWALKIGGSTLLTFAILLTLETIRK